MHKKIAVFALTRGYGKTSKHKYRTLIRRNKAIKRILKKKNIAADLLLFHEGNISKSDRFFIQIFSFCHIKFINVSEDFTLEKNQVWTHNSIKHLGYSLMCRFNYYGVWRYLSDYEVVCRVDEDCLLLDLPDFSNISIFWCGAIHAETHELTNLTLLPLLMEIGLAEQYDHKFPYTNVYISRPTFWLQPDVQKFLAAIGQHEMAINNRWGDLPVLGTALKYFGNWDANENICHEISYRHLSHRTIVTNGQILDN